MARERDAQSVIGRRKSFNAGAIPPGGVAFPSSGTAGSGYSAVSSNGYPSSPYQSYIEPAGATGYGAAPQAGPYGGGRERKPSSGASYNDISRQFGDMGLGRDGEYGGGERERKTSGLGRPRKYSNYGGSDAPSERARAISGNFGTGDRPAPYGGTGGYVPAAGGYGGGKGHPYPVAGSAYSNPSPNVRPSEIPYGAANSTGYPGSSFSSSPAHGAADPIARSTTPYGAGPVAPQVYPRGHVMEGQPIVPRSRAASPNPGAIPFPQGPVAFPQTGASPRMGGASPRIGGASPLMRGTSPRPGAFPGDQQHHQQLAAPEGFSRPINASLPYTPFDTMKIQDMDEFMERQPRMPLVLQPHDVYHEDWSRLMKDLTLAWSGTLPVPALAQNGHQPRRSQLAADLIDLWNSSFFLARGVELVLFKGRERRSGAHAGTVDQNLPNYDDDDDDLSSSDDSSSEESDDSDVPTGPYGRPPGTYDDIRRRKEAKVERKKMRRREKKQRRKERAKAKRYALYITCIPQRVPGMQPSATGMPGGYPGASSGYAAPSQPGYPTVQPGYPGGQPGYPAAPSAYTTGHSGYPAAQQGYVPQAGGYSSAPSSHGGYGAHGSGY
ncbi:hypothetical protein BDQ12DRAFT_642691 [Crucibulum laeve]|uniref:Uncharacterized protein n=1 Tax=Crucibulum laeve TaxID=68775 RepID=A0A5C3MCQ8_9AGAR|nr:hypothetical protein BDQ12DRAFT_642691 [Crucibulum laeve]